MDKFLLMCIGNRKLFDRVVLEISNEMVSFYVNKLVEVNKLIN